MHPAAAAAIRALAPFTDPAKAAGRARFFKTAPGEYGEGDVFLGATVPQVRSVAKAHRDLPLAALADLLASEVHEDRLLAVIGYGEAYRRAPDDAARRAVHEHYLARRARLNNWDLVDTSAEHVVGPHLDLDGTAVLDRRRYRR